MINCEELGNEDKTWRYLLYRVVSGTLTTIKEAMEHCHLPEWN